MAAFPGIKFSAPLLWGMLSDIDSRIFLIAVTEIIKTTKELFPGSNIVAILREKSVEVAIEEQQKNTLRLEAETEAERVERWKKEASPMPAECRAAMIKAGLIEEE
jgi:hypothetical protein